MNISSLIQNALNNSYSGFFTDSRKVKSGGLFVAIEGEKFDGHKFIEEVCKKNIKAVLCKSSFLNTSNLQSQFRSVEFYGVENVLKSFRELAHAWRMQFKIPVVVIAGSVGKTTTKELFSAILSGKFNSILKTTGSQNGDLGIPMTLLEINSAHQVAVIEVGIDDIGTMQGHLDLVSATHGLLTAIGPEHLEKLINIENVAREEGLVLEWLASHRQKAVVRLDDPFIFSHHARFTNAIGYGMKNKTHVYPGFRYLLGEVNVANESLLAVTDGERIENYTLPISGEHNAINVLAGIAMATELGMSSTEIKKGLESFIPAFGRTEIKTILPGVCAPEGLKIICDYYNANPTSMAAALDLLAKEKNTKCGIPHARIAVLGDMKELGADEEKYHRELCPLILKHKITSVYCFGDRMKWLYDELKKNNHANAMHFVDFEALSAVLLKELTANDVLLIKGSRSMKMETVFAKLQEHKPA